jgi:tRNA-specific 2-thiouridylase
VRVHGEPEAVKLRYRTLPVACSLQGEEIRLAEPVDGAAPGQTAVFLAGDLVVGSATIA